MRRCSPIPPVVPPVSRFPRCAKPRKSVITVNGLSPDANGNVNAGDVRREDFSGVEPKEKMTLNEVGAKVNEVIGRLGGAADAAAASPRASGYGPGTPLGDVHPDTALRDVVEASGMSADGVRAIASEVVAPVAASVTDLRTSKLDKSDVVDPSAATEDGKAADAKKTQEELDRILGVASGAMALAESKADKLSSRQLEAVNSGIDAGKVAKIAQNESAISAEVSRATTEEARLQALVNAIKTFDAVVADSLPVPSEQYRKKLYLVPSANPETRNVKDEFICVNIADVWSWEQVGSTAVTIEFDDEPTEGSQKAARSGGIWSWVKSLLPRWLTSDYAEPATVASVANKVDKTIPYKWGNLAALDEDGNLIDSSIDMQDVALKNQLNVMADADSGFTSGDGSGLRFEIGSGEQRLAVLKGRVIVDRDGKDAGERSVAMLGDISALSSSVSGLESSVSGLSSSKADKATPYADGNLAALTADGNLKDSGMDPGDFVRSNELDGYLPLTGGVVNGVQIGVIASGYVSMNRIFSFGTPRIDLYEKYNLLESIAGIKWYYGESEDPANEIAVKGDISALASSKADKAAPFYAGSLAALTADGNLEDSGINRLDIARMYGGALVVQPGGTTTRVNASMLGYSDAGSDTIKDRLDAKADRASLAPEYSATSAYSVGAIVYYGGNIYQCKTAIADGGEAWNADHWELRKLDDFFTNSNSLLTGRVNTLIDAKVGDVNAVLAAALDGTEVA